MILSILFIRRHFREQTLENSTFFPHNTHFQDLTKSILNGKITMNFHIIGKNIVRASVLSEESLSLLRIKITEFVESFAHRHFTDPFRLYNVGGDIMYRG